MKRVLFIILALIAALSLNAQVPDYTQDKPEFALYMPAGGGNGQAVVLIPGGGYNHIAGAKEGTEWIPFFHKKGIAVVVTKYRLPDGDRNKPLDDIRNTFRYLHDNCQQWGINPNAIGIMGFSAGGHLASAYANSEWGELRPAFEILFYPVIRLDNKEHLGMARTFLGDNPTDDLRRQWSTNRMVSMETPPTIIITADDDPIIDPTNSTIYYDALKRNHVQAALHIYPEGGHGFGAHSSFPYHESMEAELSKWLTSLSLPNAGAVKVACIGNSITFGARLKYRHKESWPAQLQEILGNDFWVRNYGNSGATMVDGERAYSKEPPYRYVKLFNPDIIFVKLGTNDVQPRYWKSAEAFSIAYQQMIDELRVLPSNPRLILCLPATSYRNEKILDADITENVIPLIRAIAKKNKLDVIDLHTPTASHADLFPDKLHPNKDGATIIATTIANYIQQR